MYSIIRIRGERNSSASTPRRSKGAMSGRPTPPARWSASSA